MNDNTKKIISYLLVVLVLFVAVLVILNIWDIIVLDFVMKRIFLSLLTIFGAVAVITAIVSIMHNDNSRQMPK